MKTSYHISLNTIEDIAPKIINQLKSKTIMFNGNMGAGKTTLIAYLAKSLGTDDKVSSPTFSIVNEYIMPNDVIYHLDLYRIKSIEEALDIGIEDYFYSGAWLFIEWPSIIETLWPEYYNSVSIKILNNTLREVTITS